MSTTKQSKTTTKTTGDEVEVYQYEVRAATKAGLEVIRNAAERLRRAAADVERYAAQYEKLGTDPERMISHSEVLSWFVNTAVNVQPNLGLELAVQAAARIAAAQAKVRQ